MTKYLEKSFTVAPGVSKSYHDNYDKVFNKTLADKCFESQINKLEVENKLEYKLFDIIGLCFSDFNYDFYDRSLSIEMFPTVDDILSHNQQEQIRDLGFDILYVKYKDGQKMEYRFK